MKTCTKCQATKPLDNFYKRWRSPDGLEAWCKICRLKHNQNWFNSNKEKHSELTRSWYERNKDQHLANSKEWYEANKPRKLATTTARELRCKQATPPWADMKSILRFYIDARSKTQKTGIPHDVDHIIPLRGKNVSGLHVAINLRVIPSTENKRKAARFDPHSQAGLA